jgi:hypothetical protein
VPAGHFSACLSHNDEHACVFWSITVLAPELYSQSSPRALKRKAVAQHLGQVEHISAVFASARDQRQLQKTCSELVPCRTPDRMLAGYWTDLAGEQQEPSPKQACNAISFRARVPPSRPLKLSLVPNPNSFWSGVSSGCAEPVLSRRLAGTIRGRWRGARIRRRGLPGHQTAGEPRVRPLAVAMVGNAQ